MNDFKPSPSELVIMVIWVLLAGYGGLMSYLMRTANSSERPNAWRAVLEFASAVSIGTIVMLVCAAMQWSTLWTGVIVSSSGWIGSKGAMAIIEALLLKRLGLSKTDIKE